MNDYSDSGSDDSLVSDLPLVWNMTACFDCELRHLTVTFSWNTTSRGKPLEQWLEVSLFKNVWDPGTATMYQLAVPVNGTSVSVELETDSVYYWRIRSVREGCTHYSAIQEIATPNCIADFV